LGLLLFFIANFSQTVVLIYLAVAVLVSIVAIWAGFRIRARYDESMLDWRLARARRKSVLSGIEF
jgi:ABC-type bacteriocin/lantibiotic exporter with double-glycine peptidase domain